MSDAAARLEILEQAPERVFARHGPVMITCYRGRTTAEHLRALMTHMEEQRRRYPEGFSMLTILERGVPFEPDSKMMEFGRAGRKEIGSSITRQAYVIPNPGLGGTMLRLTVNSVARLVPSTPAKVFETVCEALSWLELGPIKIPERARLEQELPVALELRESTMGSSSRRRR